MAKVGEGDPRWLVQNRDDGQNVNNWHWTEKDIMPFAKQTLNELLKKLKVSTDPATGAKALDVRVTEVESVSGDCSANNRKGRTFFVYDLVLKAKWQADATNAAGDAVVVNGTLEIPELVNDDDSPEVNVATTDTTEPASRARELLRTKAPSLLKPIVVEFLAILTKEYTNPNASNPGQARAASGGSGAAATTAKPIATGTASASPAAPAPKKSSPKQTEFKTLTQTVDFYARAEDLFQCLVDPGRVKAFTQTASSSVDARVGGAFSLYDNVVSGVIDELVPNEKIVQKWRFSHWDEGVFSKVTISLKGNDGSTKLTLSQTGIPAEDFERTKQGWNQYYWHRIKGVFGFGYVL